MAWPLRVSEGKPWGHVKDDHCSREKTRCKRPQEARGAALATREREMAGDELGEVKGRRILPHLSGQGKDLGLSSSVVR